MPTYRPTAAVVDEAVAAGYFPPRHPAEVTDVAQLAPGVVRLAFRDPYIAAHARPAQFVNLYSADPLMPMPRPFGVCEVEGDVVSVIFAVVGEGTEEFSHLAAGDEIQVLGPLGRPFALKRPAHYLLVGGGLGVPPLVAAAQRLAGGDASRATAVFGYRDERFADAIVARYADAIVSIDNAHGNVVTLLDRLEAEGRLDAQANGGLEPVVLACGPLPMMKAVASWSAERGLECQLSMEQRMGCGYGTCVLCTIDTVEGRLKVCSDGPVFTREQLGWE
ncbi:dihydroorotate dehydrogenase electron transfer subunit [Bifidobacterium pullorum subsp. saeculare]|uniref:Dihydroorotate dehydrogenase electron transfer subunit n=1 Tax=Bifidobacterium pullorum subsp. saeculare TaxID=78257 RepID=A0A938WX99_9BIFI|nr:dihydroorotate dehydrogenase electron transfer subunit [Bifidobacterium pullorum]MBM6699352.1 dihydroorotate dehydrogenase electron transfer subunit [Bifidobacterium pullorum subsp. saeculare]